ncbi:MAG: hypothetical protein Fur0042_04340 [Cyanophyceae cyanobacterium]
MLSAPRIAAENEAVPQQTVICKGSSGLGNRILVACTALLYGRLIHATVWIDWTEGDYAEPGINAFPHLFDCANSYYSATPPPALGDVAHAAIAPPVWRDRLDQSFGSLRAELGAKGYEDLSVDVSRGDYRESILVLCAYTHKIQRMKPLFAGEFASLARWPYGDILRAILATDLRLQPAIQQRVDDFKRDHFGAYTLGVHIRYTDMKIPVDRILKTVQRLRDRHPQPPVIFLATDSQEIRDRFVATFDRVCTTDKWFPEEGGRLHLRSGQDPLQNATEALTDLYLLAACDGLVFSSRSSFGYVASLLSQAPARDRHDVEQPTRLERLRGKIKGKLKAVRARLGI